MDTTQTLDGNFPSQLGLTPQIKSYLQEASKWAKIISVVGFIFLGLFVVMAIIIGIFMGRFGSVMGGGMSILTRGGLVLFYLIFAVIGFFPFLYMYRFSSKMKLALANGDELQLTESFRNLKSMFKYYGVFTVIIIAFYMYP